MIMMMVVMLLMVMISSSYFFIHLAHSMEEEDSPGEEDPEKVNIWSSRRQKRPVIYSIYRAAVPVYWFIIFSLVLNPLCFNFLLLMNCSSYLGIGGIAESIIFAGHNGFNVFLKQKR